MAFTLNDLPPRLAFLNPWEKGKTLDLVNTNTDSTTDKDSIFENASNEAKKWYEQATEEEKEDILRRYPEDKEIKD